MKFITLTGVVSDVREPVYRHLLLCPPLQSHTLFSQSKRVFLASIFQLVLNFASDISLVLLSPLHLIFQIPTWEEFEVKTNVVSFEVWDLIENAWYIF
jgi:hypothetical protein